MTDQTDPTRSQAEGFKTFFATFAGEAWQEGEHEYLYFDSPEHDAGRVAVPAREVHAYMERWLNEHWSQMVDYAIDSECSIVEDPQELIERPCPKTTGPVFQAHGKHRLFGDDGSLDYECPGLGAHPATAIGRLPSTPQDLVLTGIQKAGRSAQLPVSVPGHLEGMKVAMEADRQADVKAKTSDHRNTQVLRDMGHDL